jgi:hypothetical protein
MRTVRLFLASAILAIAALSFSPGLSAQATMTTTSLSAAITTQSQNIIQVTSATGATVGSIVYADREAMVISAINGTTFTVTRGQFGTFGQPHASGALVYIGVPSVFGSSEPTGACTATAEPALPRVVLGSGNAYQCTNGLWQLVGGGRPDVRRGNVTFTAAAITAGNCGTVATSTVTGLTTSAVVLASLNGAPDANTDNGLVFYAYPTTNTVNVLVCNPTAGSITPAGNLVFNFVAIVP